MTNRWADRPKKGDRVRTVRGPVIEAVVVETFYESGEGGMHIAYQLADRTWTGSWAHYSQVQVIT